MDDKLILADDIISRLVKFSVIDAPKARTEIISALTRYGVNRLDMPDISDTSDKIKMFISARKVDRLSPLTLREYELQLRQFSKYLNKDASMITKSDIRGYLYHLTEVKRLKDTTISTTINTIRVFFKWLWEEELIETNPALKIKPLRIDKKHLRTPLTQEELEKLRDACVDMRERALVELFYSTACRLSEVVNIKVSDIDFINRKVDVTGKGDKKRTVYFSVRAKLYIVNYLNTRKSDSEYLFTGKSKPYGQLKQRAMELIFAAIAERAGIRSVHPHLMRHTWASNAVNSGIDIAVIQKLLGHENINTTQIYYEINQSNVQMQYNKFLG